jgi:hypothetical protein
MQLPSYAARTSAATRRTSSNSLKNAVNALRVPLYDLVSNWAYMVMAALAWNIKSWFAMSMHLKSDRDAYIRMEFRRFLQSMILILSRHFRVHFGHSPV